MNKDELKAKFAKEREDELANREARRIEYWNNLKPFVKAEDVPALPYVENKDDWKNFYIPRLIKAGAITKDNLIDGTWYYGEYRNSNFGKWNAEKQEFGLWRNKFGFYWDTCNHFQDDNGFALFVPVRIANEKEVEAQNEIEREKNK